MFQVSTSASHQADDAQHKRLYTCSQQEFGSELRAPLPTGGTLPSPLDECRGGEGFPIPGKPQLPPIQPQNNSWAGCQPPASTSQPSPGGTRQSVRGALDSCALPVGVETPPLPWADPTAVLPPALPLCRQCLFPGQRLAKTGGALSLSLRLISSFFFVKNNLQKFKISKQLPGSRTPCESTGRNFIEPTYIFCSP